MKKHEQMVWSLLLAGLLALSPLLSACAALGLSSQPQAATGTAQATFVPGTLSPNVPAAGTAEAPLAATVAPGQSQVVPLIVVQGPQGATLALLPVFINGQGPYAFALDTGASTSLIDKPLAEKLNLQVVGQAGPVTGVTGSEQASLVNLQNWRMADVPLPAMSAITLDLTEPSRGVGLAGLVGSDVLSQFGSITIDYQAQQLILRPAATSTPASPAP